MYLCGLDNKIMFLKYFRENKKARNGFLFP